MRNSSGPVHHGRRPPSGPRPSEAYTSNCRPTTEPVLPISLTRTETPATRTSTTTAIQPRPWIAAPMVRPTAPPNTAADPTRFSRARYGPPTSTTTVISPPMAASRPGARLPESSPAASGTQIASAARIISGQGTGTRFGRTRSTSQSGATASRTLAACRGSSFSAPPRCHLPGSPSRASSLPGTRPGHRRHPGAVPLRLRVGGRGVPRRGHPRPACLRVGALLTASVPAPGLGRAWRARSACGRIVYLGSRADAIPASKMPKPGQRGGSHQRRARQHGGRPAAAARTAPCPGWPP